MWVAVFGVGLRGLLRSSDIVFVFLGDSRRGRRAARPHEIVSGVPLRQGRWCGVSPVPRLLISKRVDP